MSSDTFSLSKFEINVTQKKQIVYLTQRLIKNKSRQQLYSKQKSID